MRVFGHDQLRHINSHMKCANLSFPMHLASWVVETGAVRLRVFGHDQLRHTLITSGTEENTYRVSIDLCNITSREARIISPSSVAKQVANVLHFSNRPKCGNHPKPGMLRASKHSHSGYYPKCGTHLKFWKRWPVTTPSPVTTPIAVITSKSGFCGQVTTPIPVSTPSKVTTSKFGYGSR